MLTVISVSGDNFWATPRLHPKQNVQNRTTLILMDNWCQESSRVEEAAVRSLSGVSSHVCGEIAPCNEPHREKLTPVSLRNTVDLHVSEIARLVGKHGTVRVALSHSFTSVNTSMLLQKYRLHQRLTTGVTAVSDLCVCGSDASDYCAEWTP